MMENRFTFNLIKSNTIHKFRVRQTDIESERYIYILYIIYRYIYFIYWEWERVCGRERERQIALQSWVLCLNTCPDFLFVGFWIFFLSQHFDGLDKRVCYFFYNYMLWFFFNFLAHFDLNHSILLRGFLALPFSGFSGSVNSFTISI